MPLAGIEPVRDRNITPDAPDWLHGATERLNWKAILHGEPHARFSNSVAVCLAISATRSNQMSVQPSRIAPRRLILFSGRFDTKENDMTQTQLNRAVSRATGEDFDLISRRGFSFVDGDPPLQSDDLEDLVVDWDQIQAEITTAMFRNRQHDRSA